MISVACPDTPATSNLSLTLARPPALESSLATMGELTWKDFVIGLEMRAGVLGFEWTWTWLVDTMVVMAIEVL